MEGNLPNNSATNGDRPIEYWQELAGYQHEVIGALMARNTPVAAAFLNKIEALKAAGGPTRLADTKKQQLKDALAGMTAAVKAVLEQ